MALTPDLFVAASTPRRNRCSVGVVIDSLDPKDLQVLSGAMQDVRVTSAAIAQVLRDEGYKIQGGTIARHRRGVCSCGD